MQLASYDPSYDPTGRAPGQHARTTVRRLRMRTLVALGVLAVATALLGRTFGLRDLALPGLGGRAAGGHVRDLALRAAARRAPRPRRHGRGAGRGAARRDGGRGLARDPRREPRPGQRRPHPDRPRRACSRSRPRATPARSAWRACTARRSRQAQAQRKAIERVTDVPVEPLIVFSRAWVDRPLARRKGVRVTPARMLAGYLERRPATLTPEEVEQARARVAEALHEHRAASAGHAIARRAPSTAAGRRRRRASSARSESRASEPAAASG